MARKSRKIYVFGNEAFVQAAPPLWIRTHACVAFVRCDYGSCRAKVGEACNGADGAVGYVHHTRWTAAKKHLLAALGKNRVCTRRFAESGKEN